MPFGSPAQAALPLARSWSGCQCLGHGTPIAEPVPHPRPRQGLLHTGKSKSNKEKKIPDRFQRRRLTIEEDSMRSRSGGRGERKESGVQHIHAQRLTRAKACPRPKCCCINGYKKQPEAAQRHKKTLWHPPCLHCRHHQLHQTSESKARVRSAVQCRLLVRKESEKKRKKKKKKLLTGDNGQLNMHR